MVMESVEQVNNSRAVTNKIHILPAPKTTFVQPPGDYSLIFCPSKNSAGLVITFIFRFLLDLRPARGCIP